MGEEAIRVILKVAKFNQTNNNTNRNGFQSHRNRLKNHMKLNQFKRIKLNIAISRRRRSPIPIITKSKLTQMDSTISKNMEEEEENLEEEDHIISQEEVEAEDHIR